LVGPIRAGDKAGLAVLGADPFSGCAGQPRAFEVELVGEVGHLVSACAIEVEEKVLVATMSAPARK